ncbi:MAG: rhodanese-like domain-containing protein [Planctomycetota bacterium]
MRTVTQLLAIAGLGLILGTVHAIARTAVFGAPAVTLRDVTPPRPPATDSRPATSGTDPEPTDGGTTPDAPEEPATASDDPLDASVNPGQITLREAYELYEQGAWFLDARSESDFSRGYIEGAIWMPASHASTNAGQEDLNFIPPGDTVVIYCTGGDCDASKNTQRRLALLQYDFDVRILGKGYIDWLEAGLPVMLLGGSGGEGGAP